MEKTYSLKNGKNFSVLANFNFYTEKESDEAASCIDNLKPDMIISSTYDDSATPLYSKIISGLNGCIAIPYTIAYSRITKRSAKRFTIFDHGKNIPQEKIKINKKESIIENIITPTVFGIHSLAICLFAYPLHKCAGDHLSDEFYEEKDRPITERIARGIISVPYECEKLLRKDELLEDMYRLLIEKSAETLNDDEIENLLLVINNVRDLEVIEKLIEDEFGDSLKDNKTINA